MRYLKEGLNPALSQKWLARYFLSSNTWVHLATKNADDGNRMRKLSMVCLYNLGGNPLPDYCGKVIDNILSVADGCIYGSLFMGLGKIALSYVVLFACFPI